YGPAWGWRARGGLARGHSRRVSGFLSVGLPGRRSDCVPSGRPVQPEGGRQSASLQMPVASGTDPRIAQKKGDADNGDDDPQWVAVDAAPVVQPVQDSGDSESDPGHLIPLVPTRRREPDEVAGQAGPARMTDRVRDEPPDEIECEVQHRA